MVGLLLIACLLGLQVSFLLSQAGTSLGDIQWRAWQTLERVDDVLTYSSATLSSARGTLEIVRESATHQMGYYEAVGRRSSLVLARMAILVQHADENLGRITIAAEQALRSGSMAATVLSAETERLGEETAELLRAGTATMRQLEALGRATRISSKAWPAWRPPAPTWSWPRPLPRRRWGTSGTCCRRRRRAFGCGCCN